MTAPDGLLLVAPGCPHCAGVLEGLCALVKDGRIGRLEVVNIAVHPERAAELGVRSVPWYRIGPFVLDGGRTPQELARWADQVGSAEGVRAYVAERLEQGRLAQVEELIARHPDWLEMLLPLIADADSELPLRLGLGAVFEAFAGSEPLRDLIPALSALTTHADPRVRSDACHYLALTGSRRALEPLESCLDDPHPEVREIAQDGLDGLRRHGE